MSNFERGRTSERGRPQRSRWVELAYRPPPRSERYGSRSVLATKDYGWESLQRVRASQEHKCVLCSCYHKSSHVLTNNVVKIDLTPFITLKTSDSITGNYSKTTVRRRFKEPTTIKTPTTYSTS
ncbi:hypothetical protein TNCV_36451 [Trichonephila clavipes]|nr:hypothetical protein TNCV_36451 [Trichonephila clavipes]